MAPDKIYQLHWQLKILECNIKWLLYMVVVSKLGPEPGSDLPYGTMPESSALEWKTFFRSTFWQENAANFRERSIFFIWSSVSFGGKMQRISVKDFLQSFSYTWQESSSVARGGGGAGCSPPIGLPTKMQNKENTTFLALLRLSFALD